MSRSIFLVLGLLGASLCVGCPAPPPEGSAGTPSVAQPGPLAAEGAGGGPSAAGEGAPLAVNPQGGPASGPLTFADLIEQGGGASVTVSGTVHGASEGQIDFVAISKLDGELKPEHLQSIRFERGQFSVEAPAQYKFPIVATAIDMKEGEQPRPGVPTGSIATPFELAGSDVSLEITIGEHDDPSEFFPLRPGSDPAAASEGRLPGQGPGGDLPADGAAPSPADPGADAPAPDGAAPDAEAG